MDSVTKQLRFFKVLVAILMVVIVAQCTFWLNLFSSPSRTENNTIQNVITVNQQRKVVTPLVSAVFDFLWGFESSK